jgi:hypothetical protein
MYESETVATAPVWRGDADYYRGRLRADNTYERLLDLTCYDYIDALSRQPLLPMTQFANYLSSVWGIAPRTAVADMANRISGWIEDGIAVLPDEVQALAEQGDLDLPFLAVSPQPLYA